MIIEYAKSQRRLITSISIALIIALCWPFNGIQWGDGLELVAAANHLGVAHPPGYQLFLFLGYFFSFLPLSEPYYDLLFMLRLSSILLFLTVANLLSLLCEVSSPEGFKHSKPVLLAAAIIFVSPATTHFWTTVEVYLMTSLFLSITALVSLKIYNLEEKKTHFLPVLGAISLSIATAFHLTALAALPLLIYSICHTFPFRQHKQTLFVSLLLFIALTLFLLLAPLLFRGSLPEDSYGIYWGAPYSFSNVLEHLRGGEYRQFLFLRNQSGEFFSFTEWFQLFQLRFIEFCYYIGSCTLGSGKLTVLMGMIFIMLSFLGYLTFWQLKRMISTFLILVPVAQFLFLTMYNILDPDEFFFNIFVFLFPFAFTGTLFLVHKAFGRESQQKSAYVMTMICSCLLLASLAFSIKAVMSPTKRLPEIWKTRLQEALPDQSTLFTITDADMYTMWYLHFAKKEQLDTIAVGMNFQRFPWFRYTLPLNSPQRTTISFSPSAPFQGHDALRQFISTFNETMLAPSLKQSEVYLTHNDSSFDPRANLELSELSRYARITESTDLLTLEDLALITTNKKTDDLILNSLPELKYLFEQRRFVNVPPQKLYRIESFDDSLER